MLSLLSSMDSVGAVRQSCDIPEFLSALRSVIRGERYISTEVIEYLKNPPSDEPISDDPLYYITQREREVLYWVSHGLTNKEISERIFLSEKTVKNHVSHILKKLDLSDRDESCCFCMAGGTAPYP